MRPRILVAATLVAATVTLSPVPAQATTCFLGFCAAGTVAHTNDTGYDAPIKVICAADTDIHRVEEGTTSGADCDGTYSDMDGIIVRPDEEIWCEELGAPWWMHKDKWFDATGLHEVSDDFGMDCIVKRD